MSKFQLEIELQDAWSKFMRQGSELAHQFETAGIPMPRRLGVFVGRDVDDAPGSALTLPADIKLPIAPPRPEGAPKTSIYVPIAEVTPATMAQAVLRAAKKPMRASEIAEAVAERMRPKPINTGSVLNAVARLIGTALVETDEGIILKSPATAPLVENGYVWGTSTALQDFELSAFRRAMILSLLGKMGDGMMAMQIVKYLQQWKSQMPGVPLNKYVIKSDLEMLQSADKIKQVSNSRKWVLRSVQ